MSNPKAFTGRAVMDSVSVRVGFRPVLLAFLVLACGFALYSPVSASAHFVRPFLRQMTGTPTGPGGAEELFSGPAGVAVDGEGNPWILENKSLIEFGASSGYKQTLKPSSLSYGESFAINDSLSGSFSGDMYVYNPELHRIEIFSKTGASEKSYGPVEPHGEESSSVAVDDSSGPSAGTVYVLTRHIVPPEAPAYEIEKFNASGEKENFSGFAPYISTNKITGVREAYDCGSKSSYCHFDGIAIDSANGNIYVGTSEYSNEAGEEEGPAVLEYSPEGIFLHAFSGRQAPSIGEGIKGFNALINDVAVDPTTGDVLVSLATRIKTSTGGEEGLGVVDEFDSEGTFLGQITQAAGVSLSGAYALAVDSRGDLYVVNHPEGGAAGTRAVDEYEAGHFDPGVRPGAATQRKQTSAVLNGFVDPESELNPEKAGIVDCRFEYVSESAFEKTGFEDLSSGGEVPCSAPNATEIPRNDVYTPVHAMVSEHVESGATYRYRLSASTGGVIGGTEHSSALAFTAAHAPRISASTAGEVTSTFADLSADVDPLGANTTYQFQYLTQAEFEGNGGSFSGPNSPAIAPTTPADIGSGGEAGDLAEAVSREIGGLSPATTYRFRVFASNEAGTSEGETGETGGEITHMFTTLPAVSTGLPDGRAYELVTPLDKDGAQDMFGTNGFGASRDFGVSSESGNQFLLETFASFGPFSATGVSTYVFSRHPAPDNPEREEWSYSSLASPSLGLQNLGSAAAAIEPEDFSTVAVNDKVGAYASEAGEAFNDLLGPAGGPYATLHTDQGHHEILGGEALDFPQETTEVVGASRDLGIVVLRSNNPALVENGRCKGIHQTPVGAEPVACLPPIYNLYEWTGGKLSQIDVQSGGEPISSCGADLGRGETLNGGKGQADGAVSSDGSKVFFTAPIPLAYARSEGLEGSKGCPTSNGEKIENPAQIYMRVGGEETVEISAPEEGAPEHSVHYEAHFAGAAEDGSRVFFTSEGELTADDAGIHDLELYEYNTQTGKLTRLSAGESGHAAGGVIEDWGVDPGIGPGSIAVSADGSYVYFVARGVLTGPNAQGRTPSEAQDNLYVYDTQTGHTGFVARAFIRDEKTDGLHPEAGEVTPDGNFLLFESQSELIPGAGTYQLYRYDAEADGIVCVSCVSGVSSMGSLHVPTITDSKPQTLPARAISDDGSYVFFNTTEALVPQATNGALDVYEWHEGKVSLLSLGTDSLNTYFLGASANGANVFIGTHAKLVSQDKGTEGDVYDVRICTASEPCIESPPAQEGLCEGDACSHPVSEPIDATPASLTFSGANNTSSVITAATVSKTVKKKVAKCAKGKKRSHGKCVKAKPKGGKAGRAKSDKGGRS